MIQEIRRIVKRVSTWVPAPVRDRVGQVLFRWYESYVAVKQSDKEARAIDNGLPVPPPKLRVKVVLDYADLEVFLSEGRRQNQLIRDTLRRAGVEVASSGSPGGSESSLAIDRMLDWGCGCGRIIRWWNDLTSTAIDGCDYNAELVEWVDRNLPFATARVNRLAPPLPYEAQTFDFVYAISVFTHLTNDLFNAWMREIYRVLTPGGLFFFSTHGVAHRDELAPVETAVFDSGQPVVRFSLVEGSNLCAAFHPPTWIENDALMDGFELVELRQAHELDDQERVGLIQDRWLIRKS